MGAFDVLLELMWAGAPNSLIKGAPDEAFRLLVQALRDSLFKGAPNEAFHLIVQALRDNQAIFATGAFDALLLPA